MNIFKVSVSLIVLIFSVNFLSAQLIEIQFMEDSRKLSHRIQINDSSLVVIKNTNIEGRYSMEFKDTMCTELSKYSITNREYEHLKNLCSEIIENCCPGSTFQEIIMLHGRLTKSHCIDIQFYEGQKWGKGQYSIPMKYPEVEFLFKEIKKIEDSYQAVVPKNSEYYSYDRPYLKKSNFIPINSFDAVFVKENDNNFYIVDSDKIIKLKNHLKHLKSYTSTEIKCFCSSQLFAKDSLRDISDMNIITFMNQGEYVNHYILGDNILVKGIFAIWELDYNLIKLLNDLKDE